MSLENILNLLKQSEEELAQYIEKEHYYETLKHYTFVYEQKCSDKDNRWMPSYHQIYAKDIGKAFCLFGHFIEEHCIIATNICYYERDKERQILLENWSDAMRQEYVQ